MATGYSSTSFIHDINVQKEFERVAKSINSIIEELPQPEKQKEQKKFGEDINTGDRIITIGGIHGKISKKNDDGTYLMEGERNSYMIIEASSISMEMTMAYRKKQEGIAAK